jgi:SAM-dependent methyltransferase
MDFTRFDVRRYRTLPVRDGYSEWVKTYEATVPDELDIRLLARIESVRWPDLAQAVDLACGTGRIGLWLTANGVRAIDGVDFTPQMLDAAQQKGVYRHLQIGDMRHTGLGAGTYDLCIEVLADEHIPDLLPLYREAARITKTGSQFVIVGYHPHFLMNGIPAHFESAGGEPVAIESYVHLFSDHVRAAHAANWSLVEMHEGLIDDQWLARKPKWEKYRDQPVSFAVVWRLLA